MKNINFEEAVKLREKIRENFEKLEGMEKRTKHKELQNFWKRMDSSMLPKIIK